MTRSTEWLEYDPAEYPFGMNCLDCGYHFSEGESYCSTFTGRTISQPGGPIAVWENLCGGCLANRMIEEMNL